MQQYRPFGLLGDDPYAGNDPRRALGMSGGGASGQTPNADALGQLLYGLTNVGGMQDAAGLLGGPSLRENLAQGNKFDATMQGVGMIPVVGGAAKLAMAGIPKAAKAAAKMAKAADAVSEAAPVGIIAYHGSPHSFDRFDMSKIGTGEGAQAYGHGLYFADSEGVAKSYRDKLGMGNVEINGRPAADLASESYNLPYGQQPTVEHKIADIISSYGDNARPVMEARYPELLKAYDELKAAGTIKEPGSMYQVRINADPEHFLDYEKPLSAQSPVVQDLVAKIPAAPDRASWPHITGNDLHEQLRVDAMGDDAFMGSSGYRMQRRNEAAVDVAKALREAGIPGIKYLDQGSRYIPQNLPDNPIANEARQFLSQADGDYGKALEAFRASNPVERFSGSERDEIEKVIKSAAKQPTHNYVVFDDSLINILKKYGLVGLLGGGAAIGASQSPNAQQGAPLL